MNDPAHLIEADFPEHQAAHMTVILGKIMALEALIDMLWTNELAKTEDPRTEADELKKMVLNDLVIYDSDNPVQEQAFDALETRLGSIARRVATLD